MKRVLMIAFHFPPFAGGSGIHRTLKFCTHLQKFGWEPLILSASPIAYPATDKGRIKEIPTDIRVKRAFALDTTRHLAIIGRYLKWMAFPDRWISWWFGAVPAGLRMVRKFRPSIIWSTYPTATAHLIGLTLHQLTGIPWIADFRDSMVDDSYPTEPAKRRIYSKIEKMCVNSCTRAVFTTPGALRLYQNRYPHLPVDRWAMIANGYEEEDFLLAERSATEAPSSNGLITLVHSGLLYPLYRNPSAFFEALGELRRLGKISPRDLRVVLRASGSEDTYFQQICNNGIEDIVKLEAGIPYQKALVEMLQADGLLLFQASNCNDQIPAKLYEYLRARSPILAFTDWRGDTAAVLKAAGIDTIVSLDSKEEIAKGILDFIGKIREGRAPVAAFEQIIRHSRESRTKELANLLSSMH